MVNKRIGGCHSSLKSCLRSRHFIFSLKGAVFSFPGSGENNNFLSHYIEFFPGTSPEDNEQASSGSHTLLTHNH